MKTETMQYKKMGNISDGIEKSKNYWLLTAFLSKGNLILIPFAFLLGRASIIGGLMPFGISFYAAAMGLGLNRLLIAIFVLLGMITGGGKEQIYVTGAGIILFNAFCILIKSKKSKANFKYAVTAFLSVLIPQLVMVYLQGFLLYDLLKALLQSSIVFLLIFVFRYAAPAIVDIHKRHILSNEETISIAIMISLAISGLSGIQLIGFTLRNLLCILVILLFSYRSGPGAGAAIGVAVGLIISMSSTVTPFITGAYAFCGLLSGIFRKLGKMGSSLGFIMGNVVLTLYLNGSTEVLIHLKEIVFAVIVFMIIPHKLIDVITSTFDKNTGTYGDKQSYSERIKEITVQKLDKFSRAFKELSITFGEISETRVVTDKQDISLMFDRVADKVCRSCSLCLHCWDRNFYNTYQVLFKIIERLDLKGRLDQEDIPEYFLDRCERVNEFVEAVNNIYELFKMDMVWKNKIGESRNLVSQQLDGLSEVISNLASEIGTDVHFRGELENVILMELNKAGIKTRDVVVYENKWGKYVMRISHRGCRGKRSCVSHIEKLVSEVAGRKMSKENSECSLISSNGTCVLKLVEEESFRVTTGVAKMPKYDSTVSGDSHTLMNMGEGKYIVALSDGMGSGHKAAIQSRATISLLEQFMECGFDKDTTLRIINSVLVLKSNDDSFSTIDLSIINLYNGDAEFVKIGAVATFIKRAEKTEVVRSTTLPAGILSNVEMEIAHKKIENGDFIIMMTDGVIDSFKGDDGGEKAFQKYISEAKSTNPQQIADGIIDRACENCGGRPADDMMVLAAKVWKRTGV